MNKIIIPDPLLRAQEAEVCVHVYVVCAHVCVCVYLVMPLATLEKKILIGLLYLLFMFSTPIPPCPSHALQFSFRL